MDTLGVGAVWLLAWLSWGLFPLGSLPNRGVLILMPVVAIIGCFCFLIAHRLMFNTRGASLLSATGWTVLAVIFLLMTATFVVGAIRLRSYELMKGSVLSAAFSLACAFARAQAVRRRTSRW
jgi:hypothetical protein